MPDDELVRRLRAAGCVFAEREAQLLRAATDDPRELDALTARRVAGQPLEHVLGWAEFCGLRLAVAPGVFVPRHRSELLVDLAARRLRTGDVLVDLCCGTGALAAALSARVPGLLVHAADVDPTAVRCARANLPGAHVHTGDLFAALPAHLAGAVAVVVANVPYVPSAQVALMPPEAREHEASAGLDGGADGLDVLRRVVAGVGRWLRPGGALVVEVGEAQVPAAVRAARAAGLEAATATDEDGETTALVALRPSAEPAAAGPAQTARSSGVRPVTAV
ncbi:putative protein N(5)-glutamine methyltransferase [Kineococcus gypseus]|uniref:putative protein N(5)-glutamine methyltransferase n=1 Tax=Kineococcus gypseus TaxID=1637102 RepID=UPI003D7DB74B